jgi:hypothetical protein
MTDVQVLGAETVPFASGEAYVLHTAHGAFTYYARPGRSQPEYAVVNRHLHEAFYETDSYNEHCEFNRDGPCYFDGTYLGQAQEDEQAIWLELYSWARVYRPKEVA